MTQCNVDPLLNGLLPVSSYVKRPSLLPDLRYQYQPYLRYQYQPYIPSAIKCSDSQLQ